VGIKSLGEEVGGGYCCCGNNRGWGGINKGWWGVGELARWE